MKDTDVERFMRHLVERVREEVYEKYEPRTPDEIIEDAMDETFREIADKLVRSNR